MGDRGISSGTPTRRATVHTRLYLLIGCSLPPKRASRVGALAVACMGDGATCHAEDGREIQENEVGWLQKEEASLKPQGRPQRRRNREREKTEDEIRQQVSVVMIQLHNLDPHGERKLHHVLRKYARSFGPDVVLASLWELIRRQDVGQAMQAFDVVREAPWYTADPDLYAALIRLLGRSGWIQEASLLFADMKRHGCPRTVQVYSAMMEVHARDGDMETCTGLLAEMKGLPGCFPDAAAYSAVMRAHCQAGSLSSAEALLHEMLQSGVPPDTLAFNVVLDGYAEAGNAWKLKDIYGQLDAAGLSPDLYTFNALVKGFGRAGDLAAMEAVFVSMQTPEFGVAPDARTYHGLVEAYGKWGSYQKLMRTLRCMILLRYRARLATWSSAIASLAKAGQIENMEEILRLMTQQHVEPDVATIVCMLQAYTEVLTTACEADSTADVQPHEMVVESFQAPSVDTSPRAHSSARMDTSPRADTSQRAGATSRADASRMANTSQRDDSYQRADTSPRVGISHRADTSQRAVTSCRPKHEAIASRVNALVKKLNLLSVPRTHEAYSMATCVLQLIKE